MKSVCRLFFSAIVLFSAIQAHAQLPPPLPDLAVRELARGKIQISWYSPDGNCIQLAVQRSRDSSQNFRTIFSAQSPELVNNGFVDNRPMLGKAYYRIFYVVQGGAYYFSRAIMIETKQAPMPITALSTDPGDKELTTIYIQNKAAYTLNKAEYKHFKDSINTKTKDALRRISNYAVEWKPAKNNKKKDFVRVYIKDMMYAELSKKQYPQFRDSIKTKTNDTLFIINDSHIQLHPAVPMVVGTVFIYRNDSLLLQMETELYWRFKDSIATLTKDTLFAKERNRIEIHPFMPKYVWRPSRYIYTNTRGYITINLPLAKQHKYHVIFYEEDGSELFRIKTIKEAELILDKTDFIHAGWFSFELFEDDKLKEKNKFYLSKD
jgi:hypothetical protein